MKNKIIAFVTLTIFIFSMIGSPTVCAIDETVEFSFSDDVAEWETNPDYMHDGNENTYASTTDDRDVEYLTSGIEFQDPGEIKYVKLKVKAYWSGADADVVLQPVFGGSANGDLHPYNAKQGPPNSTYWSDWIDITEDTNAHSFWTWDDVEDLCCNVTVGEHSSGFTLYCSMVKVQVTYTPS